MHTLIPQVAGPLQAGMDRGAASGQDAESGLLVAYSGNRCGSHQDVHTALKAHPTFKGDFESETMLVGPIAIQERAICENPDAGPDGVGVRTDGQAYTVEARGVPHAVAYDLRNVTDPGNRSNPKEGAPCHTLHDKAGDTVLAFSAKDHGADAGETSPTLRSMGHDGSHANGGGQVAIAFKAIAFESRFARNGRGAPSDVVPPLKAESGKSGKGDGAPLVAGPMLQVRRITPLEASRLQGFPDDYLSQVPYRGKPPADGPMYRALGNSFAVPCMAWIGKRIQMVVDMESA